MGVESRFFRSHTSPKADILFLLSLVQIQMRALKLNLPWILIHISKDRILVQMGMLKSPAYALTPLPFLQFVLPLKSWPLKKVSECCDLEYSLKTMPAKLFLDCWFVAILPRVFSFSILSTRILEVGKPNAVIKWSSETFTCYLVVQLEVILWFPSWQNMLLARYPGVQNCCHSYYFLKIQVHGSLVRRTAGWAVLKLNSFYF